MNRPAKIYKNFIEYIKVNAGLSSKSEKDYYPNTNKYPCEYCRGTGTVYDKSGWDCNEGYKYASLIDCSKCNGTGKTTSKYWRNKYAKVVKDYKDNTKEYKNYYNLLKKLRRLLNNSELKIFNKHFIRRS